VETSRSSTIQPELPRSTSLAHSSQTTPNPHELQYSNKSAFLPPGSHTATPNCTLTESILQSTWEPKSHKLTTYHRTNPTQNTPHECIQPYQSFHTNKPEFPLPQKCKQEQLQKHQTGKKNTKKSKAVSRRIFYRMIKRNNHKQTSRHNAYLTQKAYHVEKYCLKNFGFVSDPKLPLKKEF
jgi:hypothetical protein